MTTRGTTDTGVPRVSRRRRSNPTARSPASAAYTMWPAGHVACVAAAAEQRFGLSRSEIQDRDLGRVVVETAADRQDREKHSAAVRQHLRPGMIGLSGVPIGARQHRYGAAVRCDSQQSRLRSGRHLRDRGCVAVGAPVGRIEHLGDSEVENLHGAVGPHHDVVRLQVAMNDASIVRGFQRVDHLPRDWQDLAEGQP